MSQHKGPVWTVYLRFYETDLPIVQAIREERKRTGADYTVIVRRLLAHALAGNLEPNQPSAPAPVDLDAIGAEVERRVSRLLVGLHLQHAERAEETSAVADTLDSMLAGFDE